MRSGRRRRRELLQQLQNLRTTSQSLTIFSRKWTMSNQQNQPVSLSSLSLSMQLFVFVSISISSFPSSSHYVAVEELGIHGMLTQDQSRGDSTASSVSSFSTQKLSQQIFLTSFCIFQCPLDKLLSAKGDDESDHADLDQVIESVQEDDPSLTDLNLNNHPLITPEIIHQLLTALEGNTHITKLSLANIKFNDDHAAVSSKIIKYNKCPILQ